MKRVSIGDLVFGPEEKAAINKLLDDSTISEGKNCRIFERDYANYIGTKHGISCNSGTSALMLVLQALKYHSKYQIKEGMNFLTTPLTYIATANSIVTTGFKPVFIDINLEDFSMSAEQSRAAIEANPESFAGLMPVHLMGYSCDMDSLNSTARRYSLPVIEDSCEAHGTLYNGRRTGALGTAGCFSFYLAHNIQAGEFGAITTDDAELADRCHRLKGNGRICYCTVSDIQAGKCPHQNMDFHPRYLHDMIGYNFKPMEYQAVIGILQVKQVDFIFRKRQENIKYLNDNLSSLQDRLRLPIYSNKVSYLGYPMLVLDENVNRDRLAAALSKAGVENRPIFNSIPTQQPAYAHLKKEYQGKLPNAEYVGKTGLYVGCHQYLKEDDLDYVVKTIKQAFS